MNPANCPSVRVLVVDDNADAAMTLVMLLRAWGLDAHMATSGKDALERLEEIDPRAIFLDLECLR
jgi:CheY-like chemotaxis protein